MSEQQVDSNTLQYDVVIVGAGPAGLSCAIHLGQSNQTRSQPLRICVIEKAAHIGSHQLSGAIINSNKLTEILPEWQSTLEHTSVNQNQFKWLTSQSSWQLPTPHFQCEANQIIVSLGNVCSALATKAEQLGVDIFAGFAADQLIIRNNSVIGIETKAVGLNVHGKPTQTYQPGVTLHAQHTLLAEGCRGSLSQQVIKRFHLDKNSSPQTYGLGIKELWAVPEDIHQPGLVQHTVGWPLQPDIYGGGFIYHHGDRFVSIGLVIGLDYQNPYLDPFEEFQQFKTHPTIKKQLLGGDCVGYGARALNEGGYQSVPQLYFPGGMILGCAGGLLNPAKLKGIHNALHSGMLAAHSIAEHHAANALNTEQNNDIGKHYMQAIKREIIDGDLRPTRNIRPAFRVKRWLGLLYVLFEQYGCFGKVPWTFRITTPDHLRTRPASQYQKINYPKPDNTITFSRTTQLARSGTQHNATQPCHLRLTDANLSVKKNLPLYDAPEQRYCPANVYEIIYNDNQPVLQINFINCLHCKTCDIKDHAQNIHWTVPEGGDGPNYQSM